MPFVVPIADIEPDQGERFGGKALSLARLRRGGLPVPPAVAVSVEAFRTFLDYNALAVSVRLQAGDPHGLAAELRRKILAGKLPPALAGELRQRAALLGEHLVVRSSAVGEDGSERSFAGQFLTLLDVPPGDALEDALRRCWASLFNDAALAYRDASPTRRDAPAMGVVIQAMVDSSVSGVLFTIDPMTGSWRRMCVEAIWGQGEALVSGQVVPDRYVVRRPRRQPGRLGQLLARASVRELEVDAVAQARQRVPVGGALDWAPVGRPGDRKLDSPTLLRLARMGLRVEALAGAPRDIEWTMDTRGRLWLLQSRPITAAGEPTRGGEVLWTRRFFGERWTELATPMGWSIAGGLLDWFIGYPATSAAWLGGGPPTRLLAGRPYVNVTIFRHLAFKLPGLPPPRFLMDFLPAEERDRWTGRFAWPPDARVYRGVLVETWRERRWRRFRWNPLTNPRAWDAFVDRLDRELPALIPRVAEAGAAAACVDRGVELIREYIKIHVTSLLYANILYELLDGALPPELRDDLLRSPGGNRTTEVNEALVALARGAPLAPFLDRYGHRAFSSSWEIFSPRFAERPEQVMALARAVAAGGDPASIARAQSEATDRAMAALRSQLSGPEGLALRAALRLTQRYLRLREDQRFHFDRLVFAVKQALVALGRGLALDDPEDIRWLQWAEVRDLRAGRLSRAAVDELMERRRRQWADYARSPEPPMFLVGDRGVEVSASGQVLRGDAISAGRATGLVRILRSPEEGERLQPGDVLVATATDPGWTPLFLKTSAVVLEMGSMLSHGAILAREYRLPAVVNVVNATRILRDGQRVTVDGTRGLVRVEDERLPAGIGDTGSDTMSPRARDPEDGITPRPL